MAEINENIKPWRREISEEEWNAMWKPAKRSWSAAMSEVQPSGKTIAQEEYALYDAHIADETDWMALAIDLYVSRFGRRCVTCWKDVANEDVYLVTRDGEHYLFHSACKPQ